MSLRETENNCVELTVSDNGVGLPIDFRLDQCQTLGLQVVRTLIRQLRADLSVTGGAVTEGGGATFTFGWKRLDASLPVTAMDAHIAPQGHIVHTPELCEADYSHV